VSPEGPLSRHVTAISDRETVRTLLGEIDTANEAALIMWSNDYDPPCAINRDGTDYVAHITKQVSDCPITNQDFEVRVHADGSIESSEIGDPRESGGCVGRRPDRLHSDAASTCRSEIGRFLSRTAHLEGSAVIAFAQLALQLREHDAPRDLVDRAIRAAEDEVRHARDVEALGRSHGARSEPAVVTKGGRRTLLSLAVENAVEGCVRECWGALVAHYQAQHATDEAVRKVWAQIAEDESAHALLSLDLGRWFRTQLSAEECARVEAARETAAEELFEEIAKSGEALPAVGLPDASVAACLLRDLSATVFAPSGTAMSAA